MIEKWSIYDSEFQVFPHFDSQNESLCETLAVFWKKKLQSKRYCFPRIISLNLFVCPAVTIEEMHKGEKQIEDNYLTSSLERIILNKSLSGRCFYAYNITYNNVIKTNWVNYPNDIDCLLCAISLNCLNVSSTCLFLRCSRSTRCLPQKQR